MQISSSAIQEVLYSRKTHTLFVLFRQGAWAIYEDVPIDVWNEFKAAESKGSFFYHNVRSSYTWRYLNKDAKVEEDVES